MASTSVTVMCVNPVCVKHQVPRTVGLVHLGQGVYQHPTLVCECSPRWSMQMLPDEQQPDIVVDTFAGMPDVVSDAPDPGE